MKQKAISGTIAQQTAEYSEIDNLILKVDASSTKVSLQTRATKVAEKIEA